MDTPHVSLVVPAHNEARRIGATVGRLLSRCDALGLDAEVIVVDDGSSDETPALLTTLAVTEPRLRHVMLPGRRGKGAAVRLGLAQARGAHVGFMDADVPFGVEVIGAALACLDAGADLAIGARDLAEVDSRAHYGWSRRLSTRALSLCVRALVGLDIPDTQCGFKMMRRGVARTVAAEVACDRFAFDVELLVRATQRGLRIDRFPVVMEQPHGSSVRLARDSLRFGLDLVTMRSRLRSNATASPNSSRY